MKCFSQKPFLRLIIIVVVILAMMSFWFQSEQRSSIDNIFLRTRCSRWDIEALTWESLTIHERLHNFYSFSKNSATSSTCKIRHKPPPNWYCLCVQQTTSSDNVYQTFAWFFLSQNLCSLYLLCPIIIIIGFRCRPHVIANNHRIDINCWHSAAKRERACFA